MSKPLENLYFSKTEMEEIQWMYKEQIVFVESEIVE